MSSHSAAASDARCSARQAACRTLALWLAITFGVCGALQTVLWLAGLDSSLVGPGTGGTVLVVVALVTLLGLMARDPRSLTEFGITVGPDWMAELGRAALIGAAAFTGYHVLGIALGGLNVQTAALNGRCFKGTAEALVTSVPIAATQQVIFSGYLLCLVRAAVGRGSAVLMCGALFAAASVLGKPGEFLASDAGFWMTANLGLLASLLAVLRLQAGSILFPSGVLAGALVIRRALWKSHLIVRVPDHPLADWFALGDDSRQGPALGMLLGLALAAAWVRLIRQGEPVAAASGPALSAEFKKFFPFSCLLALAPLDLWWGRLREARFRVDPIYLPRLAWVLSISAVNTVLTLPERLLAGRVLRHPVPDPVLIVGVHRSGTTHLHNLLALDPQFVAPRNLSVLNPCGALVSGWFLMPLLGLFMTMRRPMDAMRVHLFSTQEEEFAIAGMTRLSPYWGFIFPKETSRHDRCIYPDELSAEERQEWRHSLLLFLRKLTFWRRRTPLLKSPYNTARVGEFQQLFPAVKVVHIVRHPYQTYLSNMHLAEHGLAAFQVQDPDADDNYRTRFLEHYRRMEDACSRDSRRLPAGHSCEVRYEDLSEQPIEVIRRIYAALGLKYTVRYDIRLRKYLADLSGYTRNRHPRLAPDVRERIDSRMGAYLERWGYLDEVSVPPARAA